MVLEIHPCKMETQGITQHGLCGVCTHSTDIHDKSGSTVDTTWRFYQQQIHMLNHTFLIEHTKTKYLH